MYKLRSITALLGIIILVGLYVLTFIFALIYDPNTMHLLGGSIAATIVIPIMLWVINTYIKISKRNRDQLKNKDEEE